MCGTICSFLSEYLVLIPNCSKQKDLRQIRNFHRKILTQISDLGRAILLLQDCDFSKLLIYTLKYQLPAAGTCQ